MTTTDLRHLPLTTLERSVRGTVLTPTHPAYLAAAQGWNLAVTQRPALIVRVANRDDVRTSVRFARSAGLGVGVMATGHGVVTPCDGGLLLDTSALRGVTVEPRSRRVRVAAGARWQEVAEALAPHGLAGLAGSSPHTGVVGYSLGGGFGWLGRRFGLASHHLLRAEVVTADGRLVHASRHRSPELFWALAGGTGNFGVVTALEFRAHPVARVLAGNLYYPITRLADVAMFFADGAPELPDTVTAALTVRAFPPVASVPEPLRGQRLVALRSVSCGEPSTRRTLVDRALAHLGRPVVNTVTEMPPAALPTVSADPVQPVAALSHTELIRDLDAGLIDGLMPVVGPGTRSPLVMVEFRTLGGALHGRPDQLSPMAHSEARYSLNAIGLAGAPEAADAVEADLTAVATAVRGQATGASYVNFLDSRMGQPHRVRAAYSADDWARLIAVKQRYDPEGMFRFNRNIPSRPLTPGCTAARLDDPTFADVVPLRSFPFFPGPPSSERNHHGHHRRDRSHR